MKKYSVYATSETDEELEIEAENEQEAKEKFYAETFLEDPIIQTVEEVKE